MDDYDWNDGIDHAVEEIDTLEKEIEENPGWFGTGAFGALDALKERLLKKKIEIKPPVDLLVELYHGKGKVIFP